MLALLGSKLADHSVSAYLITCRNSQAQPRQARSNYSNHAHAHMHVVRTSVEPRLTEGDSDVVEHGCGDQLPEGPAARLAAGDGIGDLLANEAVKDDFSQTLVVVVGASAIAVVVV